MSAAEASVPTDIPTLTEIALPITPSIADPQHQRNAAARELASKVVEDANGNTSLPAEVVAPAAPAAPAAAKPADAPKDDKPAAPAKPAEPDARANTVTERIGDLTRKNRDLVTARRALETQLAAKTTELEKAVAEAKAAGAREYKESLRTKFKADAPNTIREELEEDWVAVIERVAAGGPMPTQEELAAKDAADKLAKAEEARVAELKATQDRVRKLEDERAADQKARDDAKAAEEASAAKLRSEKAFEHSIKHVAENMIDPARHPNLVNIREDVAEDALSEVGTAVNEAIAAGKWPLGRDGKPVPLTEAKANELTKLALDGLQNYYADLVSKAAPPSGAAPGSGSSAPQTATATETAAATSPVPQSRPPTTITSAVAGGETLRAANPVARSTLEAKQSAIAAARGLPPLSTE